MKNKFIWDEDTVDISEEIEIEVDTSFSEKIIREKKSKKPKKIHFKKINYFLLTLVCTISFIYAPIFKIKEISYVGNNFTSEKQINDLIGFEKGESFSIKDLVISKVRILKNKKIALHENYSFKNKTMNVKIIEKKPLYQNLNGDTFVLNETKIEIIENADYSVPMISDMSQEKTKIISNELSLLDYDIIKEISYITTKKDNENLLVMQMKDGNYVEIAPTQISSKMPYYLQISKNLESVDAKPGIIHLDIGDYYEPFN